jgi:hypothetical protein
VCNTNNFLQYEYRAIGQVPQAYVQRYSIQYHRILFISESGLPAYYSIPLPEPVSFAAEANYALRKSNECRGPGEAKKKINERKFLNIHMQYSSRLYYMLTDLSTSRTICAMHTVPDADPMQAKIRRSYRKHSLDQQRVPGNKMEIGYIAHCDICDKCQDVSAS